MVEQTIREALLKLQHGYPQRSFLYYGPDKRENTRILQEIKNIAISSNNYIIWIKLKPGESLLDILLHELGETCVHFAPSSDVSDFTELFIDVGQQAKVSSQCICIFIEDLHNARKPELQELCMAISRANQRNLPIIAFMTGLPSIISKLGQARPYAERLFEYTEVSKS